MIRLAPFLAAFLLLACDSGDAQGDFLDDARQPAEGITRVEDGRVIEEDPDDWRTSPLFAGVEVAPASPNPVARTFTGFVRIDVIAPFSDSVEGGLNLVVRSSNRAGVVAEIPPGAFPGSADFSFSLGDLALALDLATAPPGLYRLFIQDDFGRTVSYGDLLIE